MWFFKGLLFSSPENIACNMRVLWILSNQLVYLTFLAIEPSLRQARFQYANGSRPILISFIFLADGLCRLLCAVWFLPIRRIGSFKSIIITELNNFSLFQQTIIKESNSLLYLPSKNFEKVENLFIFDMLWKFYDWYHEFLEYECRNYHLLMTF